MTKIAPLMGAPQRSVLVHENASIANSILLSALDYGDTMRNKIVVSDMDFPSWVRTVIISIYGSIKLTVYT